MQGKQNSKQKSAPQSPDGNIFRQTSGWLAGLTEGARKNFEKTASQRSDEHHFDEALLIVKGLLFFCIIVTAGFGIYYHYSLFQNVGGVALLAGIMSGLLFLAAEVVKYIFGRYAIRAVFNGVWLRSWAHLGLSLCMAGMAIGGYWWSIEISTRAVAQMNEMTRTSELLATSEFSPTPAIVELDRQIAEAEATSDKAKESTWHKKPTAEGLAVMAQAEKTKTALLAQRGQLLDQALAEHNARQQTQQQEVSHSAQRMGTYGGWAEYLSIFLLLFLELLMQACYQRNKTAQAAIPTSDSSYEQVTEAEEPETRKHFWNGIGFQAIRSRHETTPPPPAETRKPKQPETVVTTAFQPVSVPGTKVIVSTEIRDDVEREIAEQIRRIQRYFSKWNNRGRGGGKPETIRENIQDAFLVIKNLQGQGNISIDLKQKVSELWNKFIEITEA